MHGMQEVSGSIPLTSTNKTKKQGLALFFRFKDKVMGIETLTVGRRPEERKQALNACFLTTGEGCL